MNNQSDKINKGFSEQELLNLCNDKNNTPIFRGAPYWTAEIYSFGKHIRDYAYYPKFLPLAIYTDHGPQRIPGKPYEHELSMDAPVMFYHSPESVKIWKRFSKKPCFTLFSPFVFYRRKNKIEKEKDANGTIAFFSHSTLDIEDISNPQKYIDQLKNLPEKFQPVSVCLHVTDIKKGVYKIFMENNISVYTAGGNSQFFAERFYNILKNFSFATTNLVCSSLFYAVEMGTPCFIYGNRPEYVNRGNKNIAMGAYDYYDGNEFFKKIHEIYSDLNCEITDENKKLIEIDLGVYDGLGRIEMSVVLYLALIKWIFSFGFWRWLAFIFNRYKKLIKLNN